MWDREKKDQILRGRWLDKSSYKTLWSIKVGQLWNQMIWCLLREVDYREPMFIGLAETLTFDMIPISAPYATSVRKR